MKMASSDASPPRCDSLDSLFKDLSQNIDVVSRQIRGGEAPVREPPDSFSPDQYWSAVDGILKKLSTETTKLSLAFSKKPFPSTKNANAMVTEVEKAMLSLTSIFYTLPVTQGKVLQKAFQRTVVNVLESLHNFTKALLECVNSDGKTQRLVWTGGVWQATDFQIPKDNKTCVLKELASTGELVQDALGEIDEAKETDGVMDPMFFGDGGNGDEGEEGEGATWSEQDEKVVEACVGLVKATKTVVKKCRECVRKPATTARTSESEAASAVNAEGSGVTATAAAAAAADVAATPTPVISPAPAAVLDSLVDLTCQISPRVDQLVSGIYAPVHYAEMRDNGRHLADLIEEILQYLRSSLLTDNSDETWLDFLHNAAGHNMEKLKKTTLPDQGHG